MTKTNVKAFTLIELLIVIVIIGILAVALIPRLTGAQASARDTARKATVQQVATIISSYVAQETNPAALATTSAATALTGTQATTVSSYGNLPINGPRGSSDPIYIASGGNDAYVICVDLEKKNGNFANNCTSATGGSVPGATATANTGYLVRIQN